MVTPLSAEDLAAWLADGGRAAPLLLDVREPWEVEHCALAGITPVPMAEIPARAHELPAQQAVVCICHHGMRSQRVAMFLAQQGFESVYNLTGGVDAWAQRVDPAMPRY
ncbi:rhodanese-like domain-containing protein [Uliginosibacterium aquaticum]|uniref:Sulfurtransferase n=1 Tax=Uliginosibacterium aquaticum TaxID=2731212 RepID=A0ABX2ICL1_9RHOO|nr:rhodanese-like domain-containing protein [Uliginosibacterium aquaticum]NSL53737.1 sulfurtransferase [Uliginosibacterium aquaticum]